MLFFILPNSINFREKAHFSVAQRLSMAQAVDMADYVTRPITDFYNRHRLTRWLFGDHYRKVWSVENTFPTFLGFDSLSLHKVGGGMQTTSLEFRNDEHLSYAMRTLDKDQSKVLKGIWKYSALRSLVRDQTAALNPYNANAVASLSGAIGIWHTSPKWYYVPYDQRYGDTINHYLTGQIVLLEEELGSRWKGNPRFGQPIDIASTEEVLGGVKKITKLDTLQYLKCRLFDILISDWDRHSGQWKWVIRHTDDGIMAEPFPIDRDMAFCRFDDGVVNSVVVAATNKFKSFRPTKKSMMDGAKKVNELDLQLLAHCDTSVFRQVAKDMMYTLTEKIVIDAFESYPPPVYDLIGRDHIETLLIRLSYLEAAAIVFEQSISIDE